MPRDDLEDYIAASGPDFIAAIEDARTREHVRALLISLRKAQQLTQTVVADRMDVSQPTLSEFEAESGDVRLSTLQRYARAVGARLVIAVEPTLTT